MRNLTLLGFAALALVACKNDNGDDTGPTDTGPTGPTYTHTMASGAAATFTAKVDDDTVCDWSWSLTGTEYSRPADCAGCDYAFFIDATITDGDADQSPPCPSNSPYPYSFPTFTFNDGSVGTTGLGQITDGDFYWFFQSAGVGVTVAVEDALFAFLEIDDYMYYPTWFSGTVDFLGQYGLGAYSYDGAFTGATNGTGDVTWNSVETFESGAYNTRIVCEGKTVRTEDNIEPEDGGMDAAVTGDGITTLQGEIDDCETATVDSYTVSVAAGATLEVSVDVTDATKMFDSWIWIVDADSCMLAQGDDQFECTAGPATFTQGQGGSFPSCSATKVTNSGTEAATYTIYVRSTAYADTCKHATAPYAITVKGGTGLAADKNNYLPEIEFAFSGNLSVTRTEN